jgi:hypothetical protein
MVKIAIIIIRNDNSELEMFHDLDRSQDLSLLGSFFPFGRQNKPSLDSACPVTCIHTKLDTD